MKTLGFVFLTMGMVLTPLRGQAQSNTADLLGTVTDQTGGGATRSGHPDHQSQQGADPVDPDQ